MDIKDTDYEFHKYKKSISELKEIISEFENEIEKENYSKISLKQTRMNLIKIQHSTKVLRNNAMNLLIIHKNQTPIKQCSFCFKNIFFESIHRKCIIKKNETKIILNDVLNNIYVIDLIKIIQNYI